MDVKIRLKVSILVFLQFIALGSIMPILSLILLNEMHFTPYQTSFLLGISSIVFIISPFISSMIADRYVKSELFFCFNHAVIFILKFILYFVNSFTLFSILYILYLFFLSPTISLTNAIIFHNIPDRKKYYGPIRVMGTIGWIVAGFLFTYFWSKYFGTLKSSFLLSSVVSLIIVVYMVLFYKNDLKFIEEIKKEFSFSQLIPKESLEVLKIRDVIFLIIFYFVIAVIDNLNMYALSPFLDHLGIQKNKIITMMTLGQVTEIFAMLLLSSLLLKFGTKKVILFGILANLLRFSIYFLSKDFSYIILLAISCHGIAYTFLSSPVFILLDTKVDKKSRAGVHLLFGVLTGGFGSIVGNALAGILLDYTQKSLNFYWLGALGFTLISYYIYKSLPENN